MLGILTVSGFSLLYNDQYLLHAAMRHPAFLTYILWTEIPISPDLIECVAAICVWLAFLRPEWSDRLLFSSAMILTATVFLGGIDYLSFRLFHRSYGSTIVTGAVVAYAMLLAQAFATKNRALALAALLLITWACAYPLVWQSATPAAVAGGILLACAIFCFGFFFAERAGVKPFEGQREIRN